MDSVGGKPAWAWIFIIEGLVTVVAGAVSFWIIQDFPDNARFLTEAERTVVVRRLQSDAQFSAAGEKLKVRYIWRSLLDWQTWLGSAYSCCLGGVVLMVAITPKCSCTWGPTARCMRSRCSFLVSSIRSVTCQYTTVMRYLTCTSLLARIQCYARKSPDGAGIRRRVSLHLRGGLHRRQTRRSGVPKRVRSLHSHLCPC